MLSSFCLKHSSPAQSVTRNLTAHYGVLSNLLKRFDKQFAALSSSRPHRGYSVQVESYEVGIQEPSVVTRSI